MMSFVKILASKTNMEDMCINPCNFNSPSFQHNITFRKFVTFQALFFHDKYVTLFFSPKMGKLWILFSRVNLTNFSNVLEKLPIF
jgi:hypothetical protein